MIEACFAFELEGCCCHLIVGMKFGISLVWRFYGSAKLVRLLSKRYLPLL